MSTSNSLSELSIISNLISKNQEDIIAIELRNLTLFTQISDNIYNIAGKLGASLTSLNEVEQYIKFPNQDAIPDAPQTKQAVPANQPKKEQQPKKSNTNLIVITSLYGALLYGTTIIDKVIEFFKDPFTIISSLLSSIGDEIVEFFQEGSAFRDFITEAFESAKSELLQTFDDLKDIFKFIIADPLTNLFDNIKIYFIDMTLKGIQNLPDWLKGDTIKNFEKSLNDTKKSLTEQKETKIQEQQQRRVDFEKKIEYREAAKTAKEEGKQPTVEDIKKEQPKPTPEPSATPPAQVQQPQAVPVPSATSVQIKQEPEIPKAQESSPPASAISKPAPSSSEPTGKQGMVQTVLKAFEEVGIINPFVRTALLANIEKESGFKPRDENLNYSSVERIKKVFPTAVRVARLSDDELKQYTNNPQALAELVYGHKSPVGKLMGNNEPGDGYKYRGRGFIQITGKKNYERFGSQIGVDLVKNPDLANDPVIAAKISALFVKQGLKGRMDFKSQSEANRAVTQVIGGAGLDLSKGIGAEILTKVDKYSTQYADAGSASMVASTPTIGTTTSNASAEVNAAKKQQPNQVVMNINNSSSTAIKVGALQESSTTIARPIT